MHLCTQRVNKTPLSEHKSDKIAIACDNIVFNLSHPSDVIMDAAVEGEKKKMLSRNSKSMECHDNRRGSLVGVG